MIGDSDNDIIPANKLGMKSIYGNYCYVFKTFKCKF